MVITGDSRGTIRAYTFDEKNQQEWQFEGEDNTLHKDHNSNAPILSLTSTYSASKSYCFSNDIQLNDIYLQSYFQGSPSNINKANTSSSKDSGCISTSLLLSPPSSSTSATASSPTSTNIIKNYKDIPPQLILSGTTDGWIRIWFWEIDIHAIQLVERIAIHQSGVNSIAVAWLNARYINSQKEKSLKSGILKVSSMPNRSKTGLRLETSSDSATEDHCGVLKRHLAIISAGDDQSMSLIIANFYSTMPAPRAARQRLQQNSLFRRSVSSMTIPKIDDKSIPSRLQLSSSAFTHAILKSGWKLDVIREMTISTAHMASVRSVAITPIITPTFMQHLKNVKNSCLIDDDGNDSKMNDGTSGELNKLLLFSVGDDDTLRVWTYKYIKDSFIDYDSTQENVELIEQIKLDVSLPSSIAIFYIYNKGILLNVAGHGTQVLTFSFCGQFLKQMFYDENRFLQCEKNANEKNKTDDGSGDVEDQSHSRTHSNTTTDADDDNRSISYDSSVSHHIAASLSNIHGIERIIKMN